MIEVFRSGDVVEVNKCAITWASTDYGVFLPATVIDCRPGRKFKVKIIDGGKKRTAIVFGRWLRRAA